MPCSQRFRTPLCRGVQQLLTAALVASVLPAPSQPLVEGLQPSQRVLERHVVDVTELLDPATAGYKRFDTESSSFLTRAVSSKVEPNAT